MKILVLKGLSKDKRTAIIPFDVQRLTKEGYQISIQKGLGSFLEIPDSEYITAGAKIVNKISKKNVEGFDLIYRLGQFEKRELRKFNEKQILMSYFNFINNPRTLYFALRRKLTTLSLEELMLEGVYCFYQTVEKIKGPLGFYAAAYHTTSFGDGAGELLYKTGQNIPKVIIIGAKYAGYGATKTALAAGCNVLVYDTNKENLENFKKDNDLLTLAKMNKCNFELRTFTHEELKTTIKEANAVIITSTKNNDEHKVIINQEMVKSMMKNSIIVDLGSEYGLSTNTQKVFNWKKNITVTVDHVKQIGLANISLLYAKTFSAEASNIFATWVLEKKYKSNKEIIKNEPQAIMTCKGYLVNQEIALSRKLNYTSLKEIK